MWRGRPKPRRFELGPLRVRPAQAFLLTLINKISLPLWIINVNIYIYLQISRVDFRVLCEGNDNFGVLHWAESTKHLIMINITYLYRY